MTSPTHRPSPAPTEPEPAAPRELRLLSLLGTLLMFGVAWLLSVLFVGFVCGMVGVTLGVDMDADEGVFHAVASFLVVVAPLLLVRRVVGFLRAAVRRLRDRSSAGCRSARAPGDGSAA